MAKKAAVQKYNKEIEKAVSNVRKGKSISNEKVLQELEQLAKGKKIERANPIEKLGFNYVFHFNEFDSKWYCIHRDSYLNYWGKHLKLSDSNWTSGKTIALAAGAMITKENKKK